MSALSKREILFVLKMQNQTSRAIKEMANDLTSISRTLDSVDKKSVATRGPKKLAEGLKEVVATAAKATDAVRKTATESTGGLNKATDAVKDYVSKVKVLPSVYGPAVEEALRLAAATEDVGDAAKANWPSITGGLVNMQKEGRKAADVIEKINAITADMANAPLFEGTDYAAGLDALNTLNATGMDLSPPENAEHLNFIYEARAEALEVLRQRHADMGLTATSSEAEIIAAAQVSAASLDKLRQEAENTGDEIENIGGPSRLRGLLNMKNLIIGAIAALGGNALIREADAWKRLTGQLRLVSTSESNLLNVRQKVVDIAKETFSDLEATGQLYTRIAQRADILGLSQEEVAKTVENVSVAMQVGGSTAEEAAGALRQFSQALGRGELRGDELNSIIENSPGLAKAFEDGLREAGHEVRSLKQYIDEAEPSIGELLDALESQGPALAAQFEKLPRTVGQGMTFLSTSITEMIGRMDEGSKSTDGIANFLIRLGRVLTSDGVIDAMVSLAQVVGVVLNAALTAVIFVVEKFASVIVFLKDNVVLLSAAIAFAVGLLVVSKWTAIVGAVVKLAGVLYTATAAMWGFNIAMLANPLVWIPALIAAVVAAIVWFGNETWKVNKLTVSGWQWLKAVASGVFAAVAAGAKALADNLKLAFQAIKDNIATVGAAMVAFSTGNWVLAGQLAAGVLNDVATGYQNVGAAARAAYTSTRDASLLDSAENNLLGLGSNDDPLSTVGGDALPKALEKGNGDTGSNTATDNARKALDALKERTAEMKLATDEQIRMNHAVQMGPRLVNELNVALAGERELREALKTLKEAGVDTSAGSEGLAEAQKAAAAAVAGEIAKQAEAVSNLNHELGKNIVALNEQQIAAEAAQAVMFEQDAGRQRQMQYNIAFTEELDRLTVAWRDAGLAFDENGQETAAYTEAVGKATVAANQFAKSQQDLADNDLVLSFLNGVTTAAQRAEQAYQRAKIALDDYARANPGDTHVQAAIKLNEHLRPATDVIGAMQKGLGDFAADIQPSLENVQKAGTQMFGKITDSITELVTTGKANFGDLARSIIADLTAMIIKALVFKAIMAVTGGAAGPFGFLLGTSQSHTGGIAGAAGAVRNMDPGVFKSAKKYHAGGLAGQGSLPGEIPVIAKRNEAILPTVRLPDGNFGVKADMSGGGGGGNVFAPQYNINIKGDGANRAGDLPPEMQEKLGAMLEEELNVHMQRKLDEWTRPGGQLSVAMKRR